MPAAIPQCVPPTFPEKYRAALIRSAEQCAVKQVLESPPAFTVETVVDAAPPVGSR